MKATGNNRQRFVMLFDRILNRAKGELLDGLISGEYVDHNPVPDQARAPKGLKAG
ncbi:hypothetical protein J2741_000118 [Methanolinea mesophila]|nr:hypothetical protein [Methanolinea mesophila]